jgi:hypothetical protein
MNSLRMLITACVLVSLTACATQAPQPKTQSILEVLDEAASAPAPQQKLACGGNEVTYCELDMGARRCTCKDQGDVSRWLGKIYGTR